MASLQRRESSLEDIQPQDRSYSDWQTGSTTEKSLLHRESSLHRSTARFSQEDLPSAVKGRYVTQKGSIRTAFTPAAESSITRWVTGWLNRIGHEHRDYSLFIFDKKGSFRKNVKKVVKSKLFNFLIALIVIVNAIALCLYSPSIYFDKNERNFQIALGSIVFILAYIVEAVLRIIAYGLIFHPKSYLRNVAQVLDVFIIMFGILYVSLNTHYHAISEVFAALMATKLLKILIVFDSVTFILKALARSLVPLFFLSILTLCVMVFFSLVGLELFSGRLHGACISNFTSPTGLATFRVSDFPCYFDDTGEAIPRYVRGNHECTGSTCSFWREGPNVGITSFDNFLLALLTVFQLISLEGWSGVFYLYESALGYQYAWLYFVLVIFIGSVFILNLWLGVLTSVFIGVSDRQETHGNIRRLKANKRIEEDLCNYREWMEKAMQPDLPSETGSIGRRPSLPINTVWRSHTVDGDELEEEGTELEEWMAKGIACREGVKKDWLVGLLQKSRLWVLKVLKSRLFYWFILGLHLVNLVLLMNIRYPSPPGLDRAIFDLNYIFTGVYILEFFLVMYVKGPHKYFTSNLIFRIAVSILILLNILDILIFVHIPAITDNVFSVSIIVNAFYSFRLVQVFKHTRYWKAMKEIINTVIQVFALILSLLALLGIFLFVFTILGLRLFGDRLSLTENVTPNFDNFLNSFLLVFQLLTTEDWHNILYDSLDSYVNRPIEESALITTYFPVLYFVVAIILGPFILVSVFLAIAVDKLSEARSLEEDSVQQVEKMEEMRKVRKEQLQALRNPEESHAHRRTLKRAIRFYSSNPQQRTKPGQGQLSRRSLWHQISFPVERALRRGGTLLQKTDPSREYSRSVSSPSYIPVPPNLDDKPSVSEAATSVPPSDSQPHTPSSRTNPLKLVRHTSDYFDRQKARLGGGISEPPGKQGAGKSVPSSACSSAAQEDRGSVFRFPDKSSPFSPLYHPRRTLSSPDAGTGKATDDWVSYERTQSLRTESISSSGQASSLEQLSSIKLDPIAEGEGEEEGEDGASVLGGESEGKEVQRTPPPAPLLSPSWLPQPTLGEDFQQRLGRESSLEVIHLQGSEDQIEKKHKSCCAGFQPKAKFLKVFTWLKDYLGTIQFDPKEELQEIPNHSAFFILSPDNRFREFCYRLVRSQTFQTLTYSAVCLSSFLLTLELPITDGISQSLCMVQDTLVYLDLLFVSYFLVEMILKMTALGVFLHRGSYFRGFFNILDCIVTITSLVPLIVYFVNLNKGVQAQDCLAYSYDTRLLPVALSTLRVGRVLRPFRAIRIFGLYVVVTGLLSSLKSIGSILLINLLVLTIFGVVGTTIFRGRFFFCTDPLMTTEEDCRGSFFVYPSADLSCPKVEERVWMRNGLNFDHIGTSLLTLLTMLTVEGWQNVMYNGINSVGLAQDDTPQGPSPNNSPAASLYFIIYMLIMTFVLVNLFVGFVIVTFQEVGVKAFRETKLDRNQRNCLYFALTARPSLSYNPKFSLHQKLLDLVSHRFSNIIVFVALLLNIVILAMQRDGTSQDWILAIYWINFIFTVFFAVETTLKIIAFTPAYYFRKGWNSFECLITLGSVLEIIIQQSLQSQLPPAFLYTHICSAFRVLRLVRFIPQVRLILWTVFRSLEIFPWVGVLLLVIIFSYAVIGMQVFGTIRRAPIDDIDQTEITVYNNFGNFPQALLVMIRVATGENWPDVMLSCREGRRCNNETIAGTSCGSDFTYFFFPVFFFSSAILVLNLFVAIIIDNFDYLIRDRSILGAHQLGVFAKLWSLYDPQAKGTLPPAVVMNLLRRCNPPVGWGKLCPYTLAYKKMMKLNMPLLEGSVTFNATLFALVRTTLKIHCEGCANCVHICNLDLKDKLKTLFPVIPYKRLEEVLPDSSVHTVRQEYAALLIQQHWRNHTLRRKKTIQRFQGSQRRRLKAGLRRLPEPGPDLSERRISDFELELLPPPQQRRPSGASSIGTASVTLENPFQFPDPTASRRVLEQVEDEATFPERQRRGSVRQRANLPDTIAEVPEGASTEGVELGLERRYQRPLSEVSLQSDLSFASAYSTPKAGSLASIPSASREGEGEGGGEDSFSYQPMETTV